jgi:hypothetical protein
VDDNRKWVHLNPCTFSEFAALFADELAERWILVADYVMDYKQLPRYGETIRQLVRDMHSYGEEDGLVGVWDPDGKPLFSVPRSDVDLGEYLREVCELPAVSLTPWVACVPFRDLLRHRSEIPRTGNFTWLDVSGPPDAPPLPGLGLSPSPEWEVVHAHSDRWLMALGSRFCYMNHDDDWLTVFFRDGSDLRRLVAYALQRAGGYRCPASARTPLPDPVIDHVLAHGAVCPQPAEPSGPQACCLRLLEFRKEWIEPLGKEWTAAELAQAMTIIFDAGAQQWSLVEPAEAVP